VEENNDSKDAADDENFVGDETEVFDCDEDP
jgi:hypothetical protein